MSFVRSVGVSEEVAERDEFPFGIPAVRALAKADGPLALDPKVTFLIGENGSGKSTLLEAIAVAYGFNAEGGSKNFSFTTRETDVSLQRHLRLVRSAKRAKDGFFLRAESLFNVATQIEQLEVEGYGDRSLHDQSHGESFLALVNHRFRGHGFYVLDEPEAALSPQRQLSLLHALHHLVEDLGSQLLVATHSPILLAYPRATIFQLSDEGIAPIAYDDAPQVQLTRAFLASPERYLKHLFARPDDE
jgi:predicted ATPase